MDLWMFAVKTVAGARTVERQRRKDIGRADNQRTGQRSQWRTLDAVYKAKGKSHVLTIMSVHELHPICLAGAERIPLELSNFATFELFIATHDRT